MHGFHNLTISIIFSWTILHDDGDTMHANKQVVTLPMEKGRPDWAKGSGSYNGPIVHAQWAKLFVSHCWQYRYFDGFHGQLYSGEAWVNNWLARVTHPMHEDPCHCAVWETLNSQTKMHSNLHIYDINKVYHKKHTWYWKWQLLHNLAVEDWVQDESARILGREAVNQFFPLPDQGYRGLHATGAVHTSAKQQPC